MATVKRKALIKVKDETKLPDGPASRKVRKGLKIESLPDAIVDGVWTCHPGDEVVVVVRRGAKPTPVLHTYKRTTGDLIELWDEDQHRWFCFTVQDALKNSLPIKILFRAAQPLHQ